ncbi:hypothetical protein B0H66DRAFT_38947 [Apodospora peruviana]|uniref:Uncharacterized protein n=1 Tax=Apodospora peruviana TaxID=516989 RepID=A0AAE0IRV0_9PEZI|nr:hypothetical protein B0H66DRAFT_38947 [Apodospora peruviana]
MHHTPYHTPSYPARQAKRCLFLGKKQEETGTYIHHLSISSKRGNGPPGHVVSAIERDEIPSIFIISTTHLFLLFRGFKRRMIPLCVGLRHNTHAPPLLWGAHFTGDNDFSRPLYEYIPLTLPLEDIFSSVRQTIESRLFLFPFFFFFLCQYFTQKWKRVFRGMFYLVCDRRWRETHALAFGFTRGLYTHFAVVRISVCY